MMAYTGSLGMGLLKSGVDALWYGIDTVKYVLTLPVQLFVGGDSSLEKQQQIALEKIQELEKQLSRALEKSSRLTSSSRSTSTTGSIEENRERGPAKVERRRPVHPMCLALQGKATTPEVDSRLLAEKNEEIARLRSMVKMAVSQGLRTEPPPLRDAKIIEGEIVEKEHEIQTLEEGIEQLEIEHDQRLEEIKSQGLSMVKKMQARMSEGTRHDAHVREYNSSLNEAKRELGDLKIELWRRETPEASMDSIERFIDKLADFLLLPEQSDTLKEMHQAYHPYRGFGKSSEGKIFKGFLPVLLRKYFASLKPVGIDESYWEEALENATEGKNPERGQEILSYLGVPLLTEVKANAFQKLIYDRKEMLLFQPELTSRLFG